MECTLWILWQRNTVHGIKAPRSRGLWVSACRLRCHLQFDKCFMVQYLVMCELQNISLQRCVSCNSVREFFSYVNPKVNELYTAYTITYVALHEMIWSMVVWCTQDLRWDGCSFMWHQPCECCKYTTSVDIQKTHYKASHSCRTSCERSESAQESGE